jgi:cysteinyl-tRNA synthetase
MHVLDVLPGEAGSTTVSAALRGDGAVLSTSPPEVASEQPAWAEGWAAARLAARSRRDYKEADRIRDLLKAAGWEVRDNKDGTAEVRRI